MTNEQAKDILEKYLALDSDVDSDYIQAQKVAIKALEQEPRIGHWVDITNKNGTVIAVRCNCCEKSPKYAIKSIFCPNCGAEMESEGEE